MNIDKYLIICKNYLALCKIKIVFLILLTAVVGMLLSQPTIPNISLMLIASIGIGFSAASAAVINHIIDQDIDKKMGRTKNRPLALGQVAPIDALIWSVFLGAVGLFVLAVFVNILTAVLTFCSLIGYAIIYTKILKWLTPQNIVIGGLSGATPPLIGWTSITGEVHEFAFLLLLIVFVWTPPHFWALAIYRKEEYKKASVPMLPITHGNNFTRQQILFYTILLLLISILPFLASMSNLIYLASSIILGIIFLVLVIKMILHPENKILPMQTFTYSIYYLMLLFMALIVDHYIIISL